MVGIQAVVMAAFTRLARTRLTFALAMSAVFFTLGGNFAMAPTVTSGVFGVGSAAQIYACLFFAFATAAVSGTFVTKALLASGWGTVFRTMAAASAVALALNTQLRQVN